MIWIVFWVALALAQPTTASAHEGHEHGGPKVEITTAVAPRFEAASADFELVGVLKKDELIVYLDRFGTNRPVDDAQVTATANGEAVEVEETAKATYRIITPELKQPKRIEFIFTIVAPDATDLLAGTLEVSEIKPSAQVKQFFWEALRQRIGAWGLPAAIGFAFGALSILATRAWHRHRSEFETMPSDLGTLEEAESVGLEPSRKIRRIGASALAVALALLTIAQDARADAGHGGDKKELTINADLPQRLPDGSLFVPKETQRLLTVLTVPAGKSDAASTAQLTGEIIPDPNGFGRIQSPVDGRIEPPETGLPLVGQKIEKGQVLAYVTPIIPTADQSVYVSTVGEIETQIALAEQKLSRISRIPSVIAKKDIDDTKTELENLIKRRANVRASLAERQALVAPISGVLSVATAVPGQIATARDTLFEVVDPQRLWVEAIAFDNRVGSDIVEASAVTSTGESFKLHLVGRSLTLRQQGTAINFSIENPTGALGIGKPVTVIAKTGSLRQGMVLPQAAIVRGANGVSVVWTHTAAERFTPNVVKFQALDGERALVEGGLQPDERVVVEGATLLNQIR